MDEQNEIEEAKQKAAKRRNRFLTILSFVFLIAGAFWVLSLFNFGFRHFHYGLLDLIY